MSLRKFTVDVAVTFAVTLAVTVAVTFLWNLASGREAAPDWETAFRLAIILGLSLPLTRMRDGGTHK